MGLPVELLGRPDDSRGNLRVRWGRIEEHLVGLDREDRDVAGTGRHVSAGKADHLLTKEVSRRCDRAMFLAITGSRIFEAPASDALVDLRPAFSGIHGCSGEDTAIVGTAGLRPMRVDSAVAVREHEAMAV